MGAQSAAFLGGEGDAWMKRNKAKVGKGIDPVMHSLAAAKIKPKRVLEIGCANGWRLYLLEKKYSCEINGIDPITNGEFDHGTATDVGWWPVNQFDCLIYGFCLYLCDREDLFKIAYQGDRVLKDGGYLVIYDFDSVVLRKTPYKHKKGLFSYKMEYEKLWLCNPAYSLKSRLFYESGKDSTVVTILQKNLKGAWK